MRQHELLRSSSWPSPVRQCRTSRKPRSPIRRVSHAAATVQTAAITRAHGRGSLASVGQRGVLGIALRPGLDTVVNATRRGDRQDMEHVPQAQVPCQKPETASGLHPSQTLPGTLMRSRQGSRSARVHRSGFSRYGRRREELRARRLHAHRGTERLRKELRAPTASTGPCRPTRSRHSRPGGPDSTQDAQIRARDDRAPPWKATKIWDPALLHHMRAVIRRPRGEASPSRTCLPAPP